MLLRNIKKYLKAVNKPVTLEEITSYLKSDEQSVQLAISHWISKGKVKTLEPGCNLQCHGCSISGQMYQWSY